MNTDVSTSWAIEESPTVEATYHPNGNRELVYKTHDWKQEYATILQTCDGPDLLEQTHFLGRAGNAIDRSVAHPACADGKLMPEDFRIPG